MMIRGKEFSLQNYKENFKVFDNKTTIYPY